MYEPHPSKKLTDAFRIKPYQGAPPESAKFLFVGLDANYAKDVESSPIFPKLMEYHEDGPAFWQRYGVHHPFRLSEYSGDGKKYHRNFAQIGFGPEHAQDVSFVEVLHVPTIQTSNLKTTDLNLDHLNMLVDAMFNGRALHIFISDKVARLMHGTGRFQWLSPVARDSRGGLNVYFTSGEKTFYKHLHFSTYGKFEERRAKEALLIRALI